MLVSVLVPVYNTSPYLDRCMESLLGQTFGDFEVILINDGSTDDSLIKALDWQKKDSRVRVYSYSNSGISKTRNRALDKARGEYVMFVDSDDCIEIRMLEVMVREAQRRRLDILQCSFVMDYGPLPFIRSFPGRRDFETVEAMHMLAREKYLNNYPWGKLYRRSCFDGIRFPVDIHGFEDTCTVFKAVARGRRIGTIPDRFYHYKQRMGSLTNCMSLDTVYLMRHAYEYQEKTMKELFPGEAFSFDQQYYNTDMVIIYTLILFCRRRDDPKFVEARFNWKKLPVFPVLWAAYYAWLGIALLKLTPSILEVDDIQRQQLE